MNLQQIMDVIMGRTTLGAPQPAPNGTPVAKGAPVPRLLQPGIGAYGPLSPAAARDSDPMNAINRGTYGVAGAPPPGPMPDQVLRPATQPGMILRDAPAVNLNMRARVINPDSVGMNGSLVPTAPGVWPPPPPKTWV